MEKDNEILKRLNSITDKEWREIVDRLTKWVRFKLWGKITFGAHSDYNLGGNPIDFYVDGAIEKLFSLEWEWKYEKYTLLKQLQAIAGSMISENVRKYSTKEEMVIPVEDEKLIFLIEKNSYEEYDDSNYQLFLDTLSICTNDDEELQLYSTAVLTCNSFDEISNELGWDKSKLYTMQKKLTCRIIKHLETKKNSK